MNLQFDAADLQPIIDLAVTTALDRFQAEQGQLGGRLADTLQDTTGAPKAVRLPGYGKSPRQIRSPCGSGLSVESKHVPYDTCGAFGAGFPGYYMPWG